SVNVFPVPMADFDFDKAETCGVPMNVSFTNQSIGGLDYTWTFGDGQESDVTQPHHTYNTDGNFPVALLVENMHGCQDSISTNVEIYQQPVAGFSIPAQILCEDAPIDIINQSSQALTYCWLLNGELYSEATDLTLSIPDPGVYSLSLVAKYNELCQDTFTLAQGIEVFVTPHADFSYIIDQQERILGDVQFENLSERFDRLNWDFGDGNSSVELNPFHEYDINRDIEVILYAFHDNGGIITCIDTISKNIAPEWLVTFFAPNAFSPDYGEDLVRVFKPVGIGLAEYEISVYSPWGQRVWYSTAIVDQHPSESWNGQLDNTGEALPQGAFSWLAKVGFVNGDSRVYKGSVTLLR
ncbi:MAG TPA: PKD domain-containing protein, partial [Saprospiraceae bacterium]|nr:PKD domain-containing protein [Saprospiraceae bacterium]